MLVVLNGLRNDDIIEAVVSKIGCEGTVFMRSNAVLRWACCSTSGDSLQLNLGGGIDSDLFNLLVGAWNCEVVTGALRVLHEPLEFENVGLDWVVCCCVDVKFKFT